MPSGSPGALNHGGHRDHRGGERTQSIRRPDHEGAFLQFQVGQSTGKGGDFEGRQPALCRYDRREAGAAGSRWRERPRRRLRGDASPLNDPLFSINSCSQVIGHTPNLSRPNSHGRYRGAVHLLANVSGQERRLSGSVEEDGAFAGVPCSGWFCPLFHRSLISISRRLGSSFFPNRSTI